ncbi:MAG: hypothetical protein AAB074_22180 [Planctomycetota bacterium]
MRPDPLIAFLLLLASASTALPDALWTRAGDCVVGEVTEEGDYYRVKTAQEPEGVLVPKSAVVERLPSAEVMLRELDIEIEEARRLSEGIEPGMANVADHVKLVDARLDWCEARIEKLLGTYTSEHAGCAKLRPRIAEIRKVTAAAGVVGGAVAKRPGPPRISPAEEAPGTWIPSSPTDVAVKEILMRPPPGTACEGAAAAAKVMQKRLAASGIKGIEINVLDRAGASLLRFSSGDGLDREACERIRWFGTFPGRSFEGKLEAFPRPEIMALHGGRPNPDALDRVKGPPGTKWHLFNSAGVILLSDDPVFRGGDFRNAVVDPLDSCVTFELPPQMCQVLRKTVTLPAGKLETSEWALVLDGHAFRVKGARLVFEASGREWVKGQPRVTVGPGGGFKTTEGHWEERPGRLVWVKTGLVESGWKRIRVALENPMEIVLSPEE